MADLFPVEEGSTRAAPALANMRALPMEVCAAAVAAAAAAACDACDSRYCCGYCCCCCCCLRRALLLLRLLLLRLLLLLPACLPAACWFLPAADAAAAAKIHLILRPCLSMLQSLARYDRGLTFRLYSSLGEHMFRAVPVLCSVFSDSRSCFRIPRSGAGLVRQTTGQSRLQPSLVSACCRGGWAC